MFVSPAYAQAAGQGGIGGFEALLPLLLIFVVFYFLLIRPQQKKMKQHKEMLGSIRRGDRIVTGGGIMGTVNKVNDEHELTVEIAQGVRVRVQRSLVSAVLAKPEPVKGEAKKEGDSEDKKKEKEDAKGEGAKADADVGAGADGGSVPQSASPPARESVAGTLRKFLGGKG
jgi:preprotein translocase subunit YajC